MSDTTETAAETRARRTIKVLTEEQKVLVSNKGEVLFSFDATQYPRNSLNLLVYEGVSSLARKADTAEDLAELDSLLREGLDEMPTNRGGSRERRYNMRREAVANVLVADAKKAGDPITIEAARDEAYALTTAELKSAYEDDAIVKEYRKLLKAEGVEAPKSVREVLAARRAGVTEVAEAA